MSLTQPTAWPTLGMRSHRDQLLPASLFKKQLFFETGGRGVTCPAASETFTKAKPSAARGLYAGKLSGRIPRAGHAASGAWES